jgi:hypothetical protein
VKFSAATGKVNTILNNLNVLGNYEQVLYTSATGNLLVSYARAGDSAGILSRNYSTARPAQSPLTQTRQRSGELRQGAGRRLGRNSPPSAARIYYLRLEAEALMEYPGQHSLKKISAMVSQDPWPDCLADCSARCLSSRS